MNVYIDRMDFSMDYICWLVLRDSCLFLTHYICLFISLSFTKFLDLLYMNSDFTTFHFIHSYRRGVQVLYLLISKFFVFCRDLGLLVVLLCDIAYFLHEVSYLDHYKRDFPGVVKEFGTSQYLINSRTPPSLFRWLENCLQNGCGSASICDLPLLICKDGTSIVNWARKIVSFYSLLCGADQSGKRLSSGVTCHIAPGLYHSREELAVLGMVGEKFGLQHMDLLPAGVSLPLRHVS